MGGKWNQQLKQNNNFDVYLNDETEYHNIPLRKVKSLITKIHGKEALSRLWADKYQECIGWPDEMYIE